MSLCIESTHFVSGIAWVCLSSMDVAAQIPILIRFVFNHTKGFRFHQIHVFHFQDALGHFHCGVHVNLPEDCFWFLCLKHTLRYQEATLSFWKMTLFFLVRLRGPWRAFWDCGNNFMRRCCGNIMKFFPWFLLIFFIEESISMQR